MSRLEHELGARLPGADIPATANPEIVRHLPPAVHDAYIDAVATALHPVFLTAAAVMLVGFALTWLLEDVPLRTTAGVEAASAPYGGIAPERSRQADDDLTKLGPTADPSALRDSG